ncbi:hypothetical protein SCHPADRAFT_996368 [Schizopora paradoxa]|uniref:Alpha/gamma-adaptin-binding protein p34 n=1 Tax=Schizopora paradoxa TaxID=27342 RepID=A0A0H2RSY6_9AGAM|nr:hypothetical protein SCHPADRAFT_996368 [Schizopora paradoxa]
MSTFDNSCSILVVSSSKKLSSDLANRIRSLSGDDTPPKDDLNKIVWNIKNKYYSASVHFHVLRLDELRELDVNGSPALIYTWDSNEPYHTNADDISIICSSLDLEVSLAIGPNILDESVNLDDYFSDRGLEYVENTAQDTQEISGLSVEDASPGLRRAVDALSTIMWPTMTRSQTSNTSRLVASSMDETDPDLLSLLSSNKSNLQREMEALEKWLEDDVDLESTGPPKRDPNDPWSFSPSSSDDVAGEGVANIPNPATQGFDDDFADFVSAPPASASSQEGVDEEDLDGELPSQSEVREASERIFRGAAPSEPDSSAGLFSQVEEDENSAPSAFDLSRVLSALQGMKEEIASIPDERERRRAAAKVALGLVYGLGGSSEDLDFSV